MKRKAGNGMVHDFGSVVRAFRGRPGIELGKMFGSEGLKVAGKVFALEVKGKLVVKLTAARAGDLAGKGLAEPFDPGHGRAMKQWIAVSPQSPLDWLALSREALALVGGTRGNI